MEYLLKAFGLSPEQATQAGIGVLALIVMLALIRLFQVFITKQAESEEARNKISAANAETQSKLAEILDRQTGALDSIKDQLSANTRTAQETMPFLQRLVSEVVANSQQTMDGIQSYGQTTINAVRESRTDVLKAVSTVPEVIPTKIEPVVKTALELAVTRSELHQDGNMREIKGHIDLTQDAIAQRIDASGGSLAARLDKVLGQIMLIPTAEQHRDLLTEVVAIKAAVARIEAAQTHPLAPLQGQPVIVDVPPLSSEAAAIEAVRQIADSAPPPPAVVTPPFDINDDVVKG